MMLRKKNIFLSCYTNFENKFEGAEKNIEDALLAQMHSLFSWAPENPN